MSALRTALEEALAANPDDRAALSAYADLLMEENDPRGEFIQVQLALEDPACIGQRREELEYRELELLEAHERTWLGELAPYLLEKDIEEYRKQHGLVNHWTWQGGWLEEVRLWDSRLEAVRSLVRSPIARLLRRLDLGEVGYSEDYEPQPDDGIPEGSNYPCLYPLLKAPFLQHVQFFRLGEKVDFAWQYHNCRTCGEGLVELVARMPRLEELEVLAGGVDMVGLFALSNLTNLRTLVVYHERDVYPLEALANNPTLGSLERLRLHPAHSYGEGYLPLEAVVPLFRSPHLSSFKHLHLYASSMGDAGCVEIVRSGMLQRLETLDLRFGAVTDEGARLLANSPDIHHLKYLSLQNNQLTTDGVALLQGLGLPQFHAGEQYDVGSDEYLMSGDME